MLYLFWVGGLGDLAGTWIEREQPSWRAKCGDFHFQYSSYVELKMCLQ